MKIPKRKKTGGRVALPAHLKPVVLSVRVLPDVKEKVYARGSVAYINELVKADKRK